MLRKCRGWKIDLDLGIFHFFVRKNFEIENFFAQFRAPKYRKFWPFFLGLMFYVFSVSCCIRGVKQFDFFFGGKFIKQFDFSQQPNKC